MRTLLQCTACDGQGTGPKAAVVKVYHAEISQYQKEKQEYQSLIEAQKTAIAKLTTGELFAIRELGI